MTGTSGLISAGGRATYLGSVVLAGYVLDATPTVQRPRRTFEHWVVSVVQDGAGRYQDDSGQRAELGPGSVMVIRPGLPHWYGTEGNATWTETWAIVTGPLFDLLEPRVRAGGAVHRVRPESSAAILAMLRRPTRGEREAEQQLTDLFTGLVDLVSVGHPTHSPAIQAAVELLTSDVTCELTMIDVARQVGLDYDVFRHTFAREIGQPPSAFRNERRIQAAANLLRMTTMTHRAIARELGYTDEFHFSRRFRASSGISPSAYRRRA